jgi:hypothetical protein
MLTGTIMTAIQALVWVVYGAAFLATGASIGLDLPDWSTLVAEAPLLGLLTVMALLQACGMACLMHRLTDEVPREVRERGTNLVGMLILMVLVGAAPALKDYFTAETAAYIATLPIVGTAALWSNHVEAGGTVPLLIGLQIVYSILAVQLGTWLFMLEEAPLSYLRRRRSV